MKIKEEAEESPSHRAPWYVDKCQLASVGDGGNNDHGTQRANDGDVCVISQADAQRDGDRNRE